MIIYHLYTYYKCTICTKNRCMFC